jgi:hypothetical protein
VALTETLTLVCYLPAGFLAHTRLRSYNRFLSVFRGVLARLNRVILIWTHPRANQPPEVTRLKSPTSGRLRSEAQDQRHVRSYSSARRIDYRRHLSSYSYPDWIAARADAFAAIIVACIALRSVWSLSASRSEL